MSISVTQAKAINPVVLSFYIYLITTLIDWIFFLKPTHNSIFMMDALFWSNFLILTLGATTFATTVYFLAVQSLGSKQASVFTFLVPFFAIGLSVVFLNEALQWRTIFGATITIVALMMLNNIKLNTFTKRRKAII